MAHRTARDLIDIERYPLDALETRAGTELVTRCKAELEEKALCALPGFVHLQVVSEMADAGRPLFSDSLRYDEPRIAYDLGGSHWPEGHARSIAHPCRYNQVLNHQIPNDALLREIFCWQPLAEFLRRALGYDTIYRSECPHLALTLQMGREGDTNGWHFDGNDATFSLLLQAPGAGGHFEYAPYIRTETDQNYDAVGQVFADPQTPADRPIIEPGTFTLFKGDLSLHRVSEITDADPPRMIALFSFDRAPGQVFPRAYIDKLYSMPRGLGVVAE